MELLKQKNELLIYKFLYFSLMAAPFLYYVKNADFLFLFGSFTCRMLLFYLWNYIKNFNLYKIENVNFFFYLCFDFLILSSLYTLMFFIKKNGVSISIIYYDISCNWNKKKRSIYEAAMICMYLICFTKF